MKKLKTVGSVLRGMALAFAVVAGATVAKASPFASSIKPITLGGSNYVQYVINEAGGTTYIVFEDGSTNFVSANMPFGVTNFFLGAHTSFQIYCTKLASGVPVQITVDTNVTQIAGGTNLLINNVWLNPRGVDIIKNPTNTAQFGRMFLGMVPGVSQVAALGISNARGEGLYALNADCSDALGFGTNAQYSSTFTTASTSSPYKVSVNPDDNSVDIADFSTANATIFKVDADFAHPSQVVLAPVGENQGFAAGTHGDPTGVFTTGSIAHGDLVVWTADPDLPAPGGIGITNGIDGNGPTLPGQYNNIFRYDIGAGPLPWTHGPTFAANICLPTFQDSQTLFVTMNKSDTNKVYAGCFRSNASDGGVQVLDRYTGNLLWDSLINGVVPGTDAFANTYAQLRVSDDGKYLAACTIGGIINIMNLTNGIPDPSSLISIANPVNANSSRGLAFDAADNIYFISSGQGTYRGFSLGLSSTCITGSDTTFTNGTFSVQLPPVTVNLSTTVSKASQNYIANGGIPINGVFTLSLNTNFLVNPVTVAITLTGTATLGTQYTINAGTDGGTGITYSSSGITFPAGTAPSGNWTANLQIIPTANPLSGPSTSVTLTMVGGTNYVASVPLVKTVSIANTGPQLIFVSAAANGASMNRGIINDYAKFVVTRWGDTNGPGFTSIPVSGKVLTITNFTYSGTANFTNDYAARAQRVDGAFNGTPTLPVAGQPGIVINPGDSVVTADVGIPAFHTNVFIKATNVTIIVALTNLTTTTNVTSLQGDAYSVTPASVTLTEVDNAIGGTGAEQILYQNPLTNALDNTWTLTFASTNQITGTNLGAPAVIPNYTNGQSWLKTGGTNDFQVMLGYPVASDLDPVTGLPQIPSPVMTANGWTNVLRMTVNKDGSFAPGGVNMYPQNQNFPGNIALRFDMFLSLASPARNFPPAFSYGREFALFGIDHSGTNCNYRPTVAPLPGTGAPVTNWDGQWIAIDAGAGSLTPADYDGFSSPGASPNTGVPTGLDTDTQSNPNTAAGALTLFKNPPFNTESLAGGSPANVWVSVDLEKFQTNNASSQNVSQQRGNVFTINTFINHSSVLAAFNTTNSTTGGAASINAWTNGTVMLGYEDPIGDESDMSAFVYYSNLRVVELAPYLANIPVNLIALNGSTVNFTNLVAFMASPNLTNVWSSGVTGPLTVRNTSVVSVAGPAAIITNVYSFVAANALATNFYVVSSDAAGSITNSPASLENITPPANVNTGLGVNTAIIITAAGPAAPTAYTWKTNGVTLVNGTKYNTATLGTLVVSNVTPDDAAVTYVATVVNAYGSVTTPGTTLTLLTGPSGAAITPLIQTNVWGSIATFTATITAGDLPLTYIWKTNTTVLANGAHYAGATTSTLTISNVTSKDSLATYTVTVTNGAGASVSAPATLVVVTPPPTLSPAVVLGASVSLSFSSTNGFDKTNSFVLQSSPNVNGPYTNASNVVVTGSGPFSATVPLGGANMFYRLQHVP